MRSTWRLTNSIFDKLKKNSHDLSVNQNESLITDDLQFASLFNYYLSKIGSALRQQISINVRDHLSFFEDTGKIYSAFRFYESTPDEAGKLSS